MHRLFKFALPAILLFSAMPGPAAADDRPRDAAGANAAPAPASARLEELIARVREQEQALRNLDAALKTSWIFHPQPPQPAAGISFGPPVIDKIEAALRQVTDGDQLYCSKEEVVSFTSGEKMTGKSVAVCDGGQTVAIEEGNSATVFRRRYEPAWVFPPHCWPLFTLEVNFPLSVFLQGTAAMQSHPKVRRFAAGRGTVFELHKVEAEWIGEEAVGDLACVKVKVRCWHQTKGDPSIEYLWLAKDRSYHVAQSRSAWLMKDEEVSGDTVRVTRWRKLDEGTWLPAVVESQTMRRDPQGKETTTPLYTRRLVVGPTALNPKVPADLFRLPDIPESLPKFVIDKEGRLEDGPQQPRPARGDDGTTLDGILERLAAEEAKYDHLEITATDRYQALNRSELHSGGVHAASVARSRSVLMGEKQFFLEEREVKTADGQTSLQTSREAYDGERLRSFSNYDAGGAQERRQIYASLALNGPDEMPLFRAHTAVFRNDRNRQSLAEFLKSGWFDQLNHYKMTVEYVADELVGDLYCHKLKCELPHEGRTVPENYFFVWLARDRNLIAVRHEWREPAWTEKLPTGVTYVDDLREIRPGVWFPYHTAQLAFQRMSREGLSENRPLLQWRHDITVQSLTLDPVVDDDLFSHVDAPEGTPVQVRDERGIFIGQFPQPQAGNLDISPEKLMTLRQEAKVNQEETERRKKALDSLLGQPAPALPREGWLNTRPLTWKDLAGKVVVIDFWATWCAPCQPDLQRLAQVHKAWQENGVTDRVLLGIHSAGTDRETVVKAAAEKKLGYPLLLDSLPQQGRRAWGDLFDQFAVQQLPITFVVDGTGKIVAYGALEEMLSKAGDLAGKKP